MTYMDRYSTMRHPPILNDFDEHYQHFPHVEFPLQQVTSGSLDSVTLESYGSYYHFEINIQSLNIREVNVGEIFSNISGSTIVNHSLVVDSFNRVKESYGNDTAEALARVAEEIAKSGNAEAGELFNGFNEELTKPEPRKAILRGLWTGVTAALPVLSQMTDLGERIAKLFS